MLWVECHFLSPAFSLVLGLALWFLILADESKRHPKSFPTVSGLVEWWCCHWRWWINRPALYRSTSGRFFVVRQSRQAFSSQSEAPSELFCGYLHPFPTT